MKKIILFTVLICGLFISIVNAQVPFQVKDIYPGVAQWGANFNYAPFSYNNGVLFMGDDGISGPELWFSNGTNVGTSMVKPGGLVANPGNFYSYNSKVIFTAAGGLCMTDATAAGTYSISNLFPTSPWVEFNNIIYFTTGNAGAGIGVELARTDGTAGGTYVLKDIWPGIGTSNPSQLTDAGLGNFYFVANDGTTGQELWKSDGTLGGTQLVKNIYPGTASSNPKILKYIAGILYFQADDGINGKELWRSDGTLAGTYMLKDLNPGAGSSFINNYQIYNNKFFFVVIGAPKNLWESNGTIAGTVSNNTVTGFSTGVGVLSNLYVYNSELYFISADFGGFYPVDSVLFYKINASVANTSLVKKIKTTTAMDATTSFKILQTNANKFIFISTATSQNLCLGVSDGSASGTSILSYSVVNPITLPPYSQFIKNPIPFFNNAWYYPLITPLNGVQIHKIDAITNSVSLLKNIGTNFYGVAPSTWEYNYAILNNKMYFIADDGNTSAELWVTDGTAAGTFLTLDISPGNISCIVGGNDSGFRPGLTTNNLFFVADDGSTGFELWDLNGTLGINEIKTETNSILYPNPTSTNLFIKSEDFNNVKTEIEITDVLGKCVIKKQIQDLNNSPINISELNNGIYFISISSNEKHWVQKFVKN